MMVNDKLNDQFLLSAVYIIDELLCLEKLPWRESIRSTLRFVDELIVVHGGKKNIEGKQPTLEFLQELNDPRVKILHFPWPEDFDWRQIGRSCAFGHFHARGIWVLRVLVDEVFADDFVKIRDVLVNVNDSTRMVLVDRLYMLGYEFAWPCHIQLIFRNDKTMGFGTINTLQGGEAMPALFDGPIDTDLWFDGETVVSIRDVSILRDPNGSARLLSGETPRGYRPPELKNAMRVNLGLYNVDVNYFNDSQIIMQKEISNAGYDRLPKEYAFRVFPTGTAILDAMIKKQSNMVASGRLKHVKAPIELIEFHMKNHDVDNPTFRTCCKYGLPWNPYSRKPSVIRRWILIKGARIKLFMQSVLTIQTRFPAYLSRLLGRS